MVWVRLYRMSLQKIKLQNRQNTTIKIGWEELGSDITYGYLDNIEFNSIEEITNTIQLGWERRKRELNGTQQEFLNNVKNEEGK